MNKPSEQKTVQARIFAYVQEDRVESGLEG